MVNAIIEAYKDARPGPPKFLPEHYKDLSGKVALITGTTSGIGYETAKALLRQNATVVLFNRSTKRSKESVAKIKSELEDDRVYERIHFIEADLSDLESIKPAIELFLQESSITKIHYAIYNAGVLRPPRGTVTKQGYEAQIGINAIGHHLLNKLIEPLLLKSTDAYFQPRVIWLGSFSQFGSPANGGLDFESFKNGELSDSATSYGQSKVANIYQSYIQSQRLRKQGILSFAVNPGYIASDLTRSIGSFGEYVWKKITYHPVYGSYVVLYGALSPDITIEDSGKYIGPWGQFRQLRDDITKGLDDGTALKFEQWCDEQVEQYL